MSELSGKDAFDFDRSRCERIAKLVGADTETVGHIIQLCGYLYGQINSRAVIDSEIPEMIGNLLDAVSDFDSEDERAGLIQRMYRILERRESADSFRKAQRLRLGFNRNATSFSSLVDLRPDFSDDRKSIKRLIPVAQLRISTDADAADFKEIVIQLDERSLARLKEAVHEIDEKFSTLHAGSIDAPIAKWDAK